MWKIKDEINLKELEKHGWKTFYVEHKESLFAIKDIYVDRNYKTDWYRIGVDEKDRRFRKSKFRPGKTLLSVRVTKKDIFELIENDLVEKVND